jgi:hypothetical protein
MWGSEGERILWTVWHAEAAMRMPEESGMPILLKDDMYMLYNRSFMFA